MNESGRLPDRNTTRRIISDFFIEHRALIVPPVLEVGSARPKEAWWADIQSQLGMQDEEWVGVDKKASPCTDVVWDINSGPIPRHLDLKHYGSCVCAEVLEHVDRPSRMLDSVRYFLLPGAWIVITTPFAFPVHESTSKDYWRFTPSGMTLLLKDAGFVDIQTWELEVYGVTHFDHIYGLGGDKDWDLPLWIGAIARKPE